MTRRRSGRQAVSGGHVTALMTRLRAVCCCVKVAGLKEQLVSSEDGASIMDSTSSWSCNQGAVSFSPSEVKTCEAAALPPVLL